MTGVVTTGVSVPISTLITQVATGVVPLVAQQIPAQINTAFAALSALGALDQNADLIVISGGIPRLMPLSFLIDWILAQIAAGGGSDTPINAIFGTDSSFLLGADGAFLTFS